MIHKPIFDGLMHSGKPDLAALYRVRAIPMYNRTSFAGWTDPLGVPSESWYDALALVANPASGIIMVDHEAWPYATPDDRQSTASKYVQLYQGIKGRRPDLRIGWYMDPVRRDFWNAITPVGSPNYLAWQSINTQLGAIMAPYTDIYMPSLYFFYTRDINPLNMDYVGTYLERNLDEVERIRRTYGRLDCPIYPYVWYRRADNSRDLDADVWETIVREVLDRADGLVLWGGYQTPWSDSAPWWVTIKSRLTDKRRLG